MVQNKRTIKRPRPSEVEAYNPDMERYRQQRTRSGKRKSRYRMKKSTKAKIKALVLAGILAAGAFHAARTVSATSLPRIFNSEKEIIKMLQDEVKVKKSDALKKVVGFK
jgi:hypothetical protein